jgi:hypothetical protein
MTDEPHTPSLDDLRAAWQEHHTHPDAGTLGQQFDRAIACVRAEAKAEALRDFGVKIAGGSDRQTKHTVKLTAFEEADALARSRS